MKFLMSIIANENKRINEIRNEREYCQKPITHVGCLIPIVVEIWRLSTVNKGLIELESLHAFFATDSY